MTLKHKYGVKNYEQRAHTVVKVCMLPIYVVLQ